MKDSWKKVPIGEVCKTYAGGTPNRSNSSYYGGSIPWVSSGEVNQSYITDTKEKITSDGLRFSSAKMIPKEAVLLAMYGATAGQVSKLKIEAASNQAVLALIPEEADSYFIYHELNFIKNRILFLAQGSGQPNLSKSLIDKTLIDYPPLPQQKKIAKILSTVDTVIEQTETAIAKYQAIKQGLMHDLFTRGIDVTTGQLRPTPEDAPELYKESELGLIPKEWKLKTVDEVAYLRHGYQFRDYDFVDEGIDVVKIGQIGRSGNINLQKSSKISTSRLEEFKSIQLFEGDVLMALTGATLGKTAIIRGFEKPMVQNYRVGYFEPKNMDVLNKLFLYYLLIGESVQNEILGFVNAGAQGNIGKADFEKISIVVPSSIDEQMLAASKLEILDSKIQTERQALAKYQQLKAGLMQDLLTGKVEVVIDEEIINN